MLEINNLNVSFKNQKILTELSLKINKNEVINIRAKTVKIIILFLSLVFIFCPPYYHIKENYEKIQKETCCYRGHPI